MGLTKKQYWAIALVGIFLLIVAQQQAEQKMGAPLLGIGIKGLASIGAMMVAGGGAFTATGVAAPIGVPLMIGGGVLLLMFLVPTILGGIAIHNLSTSPILWFALIIGFLVLLRMLKRR